MHALSLSHVQLSATPWTVTRQDPLSMGILQEYWSGLPFPFFRGSSQLRDQTHVSWAPALQVDSLPSEPPGKPIKKMLLLKRVI